MAEKSAMSAISKVLSNERNLSAQTLRGLRSMQTFSKMSEELGRVLQHYMVNPQPGLQVLQETLHEAHKVLCRADAARHSLLEDLIWQHGIGHVDVGLPGNIGLFQAFHQSSVFLFQFGCVCLLYLENGGSPRWPDCGPESSW